MGGIGDEDQREGVVQCEGRREKKHLRNLALPEGDWELRPLLLVACPSCLEKLQGGP
jgi:hypothetical protein